jgi:hypothetical protein
MPDRPKFTPPPWNEADTIRETTLLVIDDPEDREALRRVGRLLYDLAVETTHLPGVESGESIAGSELRAAAAELRFVEGFLGMVRRSADESSLEGEDLALARFAGRLARRVGALAERIEERLS